MKLDKFVLIVFCVFAGLTATVWMLGLLSAALASPVFLLFLIPVILTGYVLFRLIAERVGNKDEDHYDNMDH